jgi:hypothetical protein
LNRAVEPGRFLERLYRLIKVEDGINMGAVKIIFVLCAYLARSTQGEMINAYKILVDKHEGKRPLGRPRHR